MAKTPDCEAERPYSARCSQAAPPRAARARRPSLLARLVEKLREIGLVYAVVHLFDRLIPMAVFCWAPLLVLSIAIHPGALPSAAPRARWSSASDAPLLSSFGHEEPEIRERFARGDEVFLHEENGSLVAYVWCARHSHRDEYAGVDFHIGEGDLWLYDAMVVPERRGKGAHPRLLEEAKASLAARGVRRLVLAVDARNRNSIVSHRRAGAEELSWEPSALDPSLASSWMRAPPCGGAGRRPCERGPRHDPLRLRDPENAAHAQGAGGPGRRDGPPAAGRAPVSPRAPQDADLRLRSGATHSLRCELVHSGRSGAMSAFSWGTSMEARS